VVRSTQNVGRGDGVYSEALTNSPLARAYTDSGTILFKPTPDPQRVNPLSDVTNWIDERVRTRVFGSLFATANLAEGLDYRINFGPDVTYARQGIFHGAETQTRNGGSADATVSNDRTLDYTLDNILTYKRGLGADHRIDGTFLYSIETQRVESDDMTASGLPYESQRFYNLGSGATVEGISTQTSEWALQSYMARLNYTFRDRYLFTVTSRLDGSSRLAPGKKFALFPSVAFAWRAIDDALGSAVGPVNSLKLRASYGRTGNTSVSPYQTLDLLGRTTYSFGNSFGYGLKPATLPNPDLEWEKTEQVDAGIDFGAYNSRITGTIDFYRATTKDLLMDRVLPATSGYTRILQNIGNTRNTGIELALSAVTLDGWNGIRWSNDLTFTKNKNEIISLFSGDQNDVGNRWFIGQPITGGGNDVWYDYRMIGIWQTEDAALAKTYSRKPGEIRIEDVNGDGKINEQDKQILGNSYPRWSGSLSSRVDWNRFDFSLQAITRQGFMVRNTFKTSQSTLAGRYNGIAVNYWTPTNPTGDEPRPDKDQENPRNGDARAYEGGSFSRIRNITLGFTLPAEFARRAGTESLRIYGAAQNPFTFTRFTGLDPEGRTSAGTPSYRTLLVGANVGF
jgi:TonB-linked SusC/RagA family outer membrane protein